MPRAPKPCAWIDHGRTCPDLAEPGKSYCAAHQPAAWEGSTRRSKVKSGWKQQADNQRILNQHGHICHVCHQPGADQVDHVIPLSEGGPDTDSNKRPIHATPCHSDKTKAEAARARARRVG